MTRATPFRIALLSALIGLAACAPTAEPELIGRRAPADIATLARISPFDTPRPTPPTRANAEMARDFLDLSFQMESGREIDRLSRFEGPVTVQVASGAPAGLIPELDRLIARLRQEAGIDIFRGPRSTATGQITIQTLPRARMQRIVPQAACFVVPRVSTWQEFRRARSSRDLDWTTLDTRQQVAVFIPSDVSPQEIRDCLHEEIAQALGPLNDLYRLQDSVFNDDNMHGVLTGFDMLILRTYYDPALRSGLTRAQTAAALPAIIARLNPAGQRPGPSRPSAATARDWITAVEAALGPRGTPASRRTAAERALAIAQRDTITDGRLAFSHFALGRLMLASDLRAALSAFQTAGRIYAEVAPGSIQTAHIDTQLAAFALGTGQPEVTLRLVGPAMVIARNAENASLLSTLLMLRAEALDDLGRPSEARETRLDSLTWGRYGFGGPAAVRARLSEVAALSP